MLPFGSLVSETVFVAAALSGKHPASFDCTVGEWITYKTPDSFEMTPQERKEMRTNRYKDDRDKDTGEAIHHTAVVLIGGKLLDNSFLYSKRPSSLDDYLGLIEALTR